MIVIAFSLLAAAQQPPLHPFDDVCTSLTRVPSWVVKQQSNEKCWMKTNTNHNAYHAKNHTLCDVGRHLASDRAAAHQKINYIRHLAGLNPVDLSEITSRQSSSIALTAQRNGFSSILKMNKALSKNGKNPKLACDTGYTLNDAIMVTKNSCSLNSISKFFLNVQNRHFLLNPKLSSIGIGQYKDVTVIAHTDLIPSQSNNNNDAEFIAFPGSSNIFPEYMINEIDWSFELINGKLNNMVRVSVTCDEENVKISHKRVNNRIVSFSIKESLKPGKTYKVEIHDSKKYQYSVTVTDCPHKSNLFAVVSEDPPPEPGPEPGPEPPKEYSEYCIASRALECSFVNLQFEANNVAINFSKAAEILSTTSKTGITFYVGISGKLQTSMENFVKKNVSVIANTNVIAEMELTGDYEKETNNTQTLKNVRLLISGDSKISFKVFNLTFNDDRNVISSNITFTAKKLNTDFITLHYLSSTHNPFVNVINISVDGGDDLTDVRFTSDKKVTLSNKGNSLDPGYLEKVVTLPPMNFFYAIVNRHLNFITEHDDAPALPETLIFLTNNYPDVYFEGKWTVLVGFLLTFQLYEDRKLEISGNFIPQYKLIYVKKENDFWSGSNSRNETIVEKVGISLASCVAVSIAFTCLVCLALGRKNKYSKLEQDEDDGNERRHISDSYDEQGDEQL